MTPTIGLIISAILAAITEAPQAIEIVEKGKALVESLFSAGLITKELQDQINANVDAHVEAVANGNVPPGWAVEPDPQ